MEDALSKIYFQGFGLIEVFRSTKFPALDDWSGLAGQNL
jgi:hypothetical protein